MRDRKTCCINNLCTIKRSELKFRPFVIYAIRYQCSFVLYGVMLVNAEEFVQFAAEEVGGIVEFCYAEDELLKCIGDKACKVNAEDEREGGAEAYKGVGTYVPCETSCEQVIHNINMCVDNVYGKRRG